MTTFKRMQKLAGLKEYEEFNPDDFDLDDMEQDMKSLGFEKPMQKSTMLWCTLWLNWEQSYEGVWEEETFKLGINFTFEEFLNYFTKLEMSFIPVENAEKVDDYFHQYVSDPEMYQFMRHLDSLTGKLNISIDYRNSSEKYSTEILDEENVTIIPLEYEVFVVENP